MSRELRRMPERRRYYRVRPPPDSDLSAQLVLPRGGPLRGRIVDVAVGGLGLLLEGRWEPVGYPGEALYLRLESPLFSEPILTPVKIQQQKLCDEGQLYGLEFVDWMGLVARLPPEFGEFFNRRGDARLELPPDSGVEVRLEGVTDSFSQEAALLDVSLQGFRVGAPLAAENLLKGVRHVSAGFQFPDDPEVLTFRARIRHRERLGERMEYGAVFDPENTPFFYSKQKKLLDGVEALIGADIRK